MGYANTSVKNIAEGPHFRDIKVQATMQPLIVCIGMPEIQDFPLILIIRNGQQIMFWGMHDEK